MEIDIQAAVGLCNVFMESDDGLKQEVSVVISPIKVITDGSENQLQIVNGCNLWRACRNSDCWYSLAAREKKKA